MDSSRKSNKIRDIVRLQQILKKWKKAANNKTPTCNNNTNNDGIASASTTTTTSKSIKFLKKTLSFTETTLANSSSSVVPKGYVAVCVGKELKRFVIPTEYLGHQVFGVLLREAEEEFGFQQEGVLKFPCEVDLFEKILKSMEHKRSSSSSSLLSLHHQEEEEERLGLVINYSPADTDSLTPSSRHHPQMCR